ncbi:hypothetical protein BAUCODRAFT_212346 [Baudoinia panamericana UAMH 10762]|uniref:Uncharacterized protein n=1 Tax=Baudoinia panamericana (strain UAMH 10762) TaxID=717646 RepID=M2N510_BAUPA|nr:uncharacterized protein BAUCODRAFT_212346 [Baudoinia panamericana UAMH 10762]EMC93850.1 hypothetical protein BAUCODRAFT_212346 [Baudoinia panamericana UAMH 10762]
MYPAFPKLVLSKHVRRRKRCSKTISIWLTLAVCSKSNRHRYPAGDSPVTCTLSYVACNASSSHESKPTRAAYPASCRAKGSACAVRLGKGCRRCQKQVGKYLQLAEDTFCDHDTFRRDCPSPRL